MVRAQGHRTLRVDSGGVYGCLEFGRGWIWIPLGILNECPAGIACGVLKLFRTFASYGSWSVSKIVKHLVLLFNGDKASLLLFEHNVKPPFDN
jgi:hypothetical protein